MKINTQKITPELAAQADLVFFPKSLEEAIFIQRQFFAMGFTWGDGSYPFENGSDELVTEDLRLLEGLHFDAEKKSLFAQPDREALTNGLLCTVEQFDDKFISPHQQLLNEFRKLGNRLSAIEEQLNPHPLDKKQLKGPKP